MSVLNRESDGRLSTLIVVHKYLVLHGATPLAKLTALCAPDGAGDVKDVRQIVNRWVGFGLLVRRGDDDTIALAETRPTDPSKRLAMIGTLPQAARRALLREANNPEDRFWGSEQSGAADLTRMLAWLLAQNPFTLPTSSREAIERLSQDQFAEVTVQNDTRWPGFRSWAPYLGFAWWSKGETTEMVIDPTPAVRDALPDVFGRQKEFTAAAFVQRLAEVVPVLDGGVYREWVERRLAERPQYWTAPQQGQLSVSLSVALRRLRIAGTIRWENRADSPEKRVLLDRDGKPGYVLSHIIHTR